MAHLPKWPLHEDLNSGGKFSYRTIYFNRNTVLSFDTKACRICQQCVKACPKDALEMPIYPRGAKVDKKERIPRLENRSNCVFCGVCMSVCPYDAISMHLDGTELKIADLPLRKGGIIPELQEVKIRKIQYRKSPVANPFWEKIMQKIK